MRRPKPLAFALLAAFSIATATFTFAENEASPPSDQVRDLMEQKRDVLQQRVTEIEQSFRSGTATKADVFNARIDLLKARLDLTTTNSERLDILKLQLQAYQGLEQVIKSNYEFGKAVHAELLHARAARLDAEIALLLAQ